MKKKIIMAILTIIIVILTGLSLVYKNINNKSLESDAIKFKEEYESINNTLKADGVSRYTTITIPKDNAIKYANYEEIMNVLNNGTGVIYFGFKECPWCRNAISPLIDAAKELKLEKIYYFDDFSIRDKKHLDENGNVVEDQKGTEEYNKLIEKMYDSLGEYEGLNDPTIKRLYAPTVVFVKDGKIIGLHVGTVDSQKDPNILLNDEQFKQLKTIYMNYMLQTLSSVCTETC